MNNLFINPHNVNWQADGVLAALRSNEGIQASWDSEKHKYLAEPEVNPWFNGRERGYVISLRSSDYLRCLNIAFFEHRNSDQICAVKFEFTGINPPTIKDIPDTHPYYESKYNYDKDVSYGQFVEMSKWIMTEFENWWEKNSY